MSSGLSALPEQTLSQMLGGLLLTYFRSAHPKGGGRLYLLRDYDLDQTAASRRADFVIYDEDARKPVAAFELATTPNVLAQKRETLKQLSSPGGNTGRKLNIGLVAPASLASTSVRNWLKKYGFDLVTYPA